MPLLRGWRCSYAIWRSTTGPMWRTDGFEFGPMVVIVMFLPRQNHFVPTVTFSVTLTLPGLVSDSESALEGLFFWH